MKHSKSHYRNINLPGGYVWGGFADKRHFFVRKIRKPNVRVDATTCKIGGEFYEQLECTDECLENGNAEWMARNGYTYPSPK